MTTVGRDVQVRRSPSNHAIQMQQAPGRLPFRHEVGRVGFDVFLRKELRLLVPLSDTTIYEMERRGEFPKHFYLTPRCAAWDLGEVQG